MSTQTLTITDPKGKTCRQFRYEYQNPTTLGNALDSLADNIEEKIENKYQESYESYQDMDYPEAREKILQTELKADPEVNKYDDLQNAIHYCLFEQADRETALIAGLGAGVPAATIGGGGLAVAAPLIWPSLKSFFKSIFR